MNVFIKNFAGAMEVKTKGIEFEVKNPDGTHLGDLVLTKTNLVWCKGRTTAANGKKITWKKFIEEMEARA